MSKLKKFLKYNPLIVLPTIVFVFFIVIGVVTESTPVVIFGCFCLIVLIVALSITLKRYN